MKERRGVPFLPVELVVTILTPPGPCRSSNLPDSLIQSSQLQQIEGCNRLVPHQADCNYGQNQGQIVAIAPGCDGSAGGSVVSVVPSVPTLQQTSLL